MGEVAAVTGVFLVVGLVCWVGAGVAVAVLLGRYGWADDDEVYEWEYEDA